MKKYLKRHKRKKVEKMNCNNCNLLRKKEAEIAEFKKEQDLLFLLLDLGMTAVEKWAKDNNLALTTEKSNQGLTKGNNQIGMLLDNIRESGQEITLDRLIGILKSLQLRK